MGIPRHPVTRCASRAPREAGPTLDHVEILLWLVPPVVVTALAMAAVSYVGRRRPEPDRDRAVRRLGEALEREPRRGRPGYDVPPREAGPLHRRRRTPSRVLTALPELTAGALAPDERLSAVNRWVA